MLLKFVRNRTSSIVVFFVFCIFLVYGILLKHWIFVNERRNHIAIWNWIQRFGLCNIYKKRKIVLTFMIDETVIQIGSQHFWLWVAIEPIHNSVFGIHISEKRYAYY